MVDGERNESPRCPQPRLCGEDRSAASINWEILLGTFPNPAPSLIVSCPKSIQKEQGMFKKMWILSGLALILAVTFVLSNQEPVLAYGGFF